MLGDKWLISQNKHDRFYGWRFRLPVSLNEMILISLKVIPEASILESSSII